MSHVGCRHIPAGDSAEALYHQPAVPIPKADYFRALREINPDGFHVFTVQ